MIKIKTSSKSLRIWETADIRGIYKHFANKIVLDFVPNRRSQTAVDTAKRILTKEKLDKQLTGQTSTSPFMSIREGTDKRVSFDTRDELGDKIDTLTVVMSKLVVTENHERRPFKPQIYKSRGQNRSYGQGRYQPRSYERNRAMVWTALQDRIIKVIHLGEILEEIVGKIVEKGTEMRGMVTATIEVGTDQEREHL